MANDPRDAALNRKDPGQNSHLRVIPSLGDQPIENCVEEKRWLEREGFSGYFFRLYGTMIQIEHFYQISDDALDSRIVEVYRLCYEQSSGSKKEKVLGDFAAHFPELLWKADWAAKLVRRPEGDPSSEQALQRQRALLAISSGFRRAVNPRSSVRASEGVRDIAKLFRQFRYDELTTWQKSLNWSDATASWRQMQARKKADQLATEMPKLTNHVLKLADLLKKGHLYDASVFITSVELGLPQRDIERD